MSLFPSLDKKKELLTRLRLLGITEVRVEFRGGGDSGEIEGIQATSPQGDIDIRKEEMEWVKEVSKVLQNNEWVRQMETKTIPLPDILEEITLNWLDETGHDWYNNEGGQGHLTIDFTESPPKFELYVGVNYMETDDHDYEADEDDELWGVA